MDPKVLEFLKNNTMSVLAMQLADGAPHTAAMHFVFQDGVIYFSTHNTTKKIAGLSAGHSQASVTVGFSEQDWETLQLDGQIQQLTDPGQAELAKNALLTKNPADAKYFDAGALFLKFTPSWWRFTDFKTTPPTFLESK